MSSRKQRFYDKLRVYIRIFRQDLKKSGVLVTCSYCKSHNLTFKAGYDTETETTIKYIGRYQCKDCGAKCSHTQIWSNNKEESE